jgi:hypothetical protein
VLTRSGLIRPVAPSKVFVGSLTRVVWVHLIRALYSVKMLNRIAFIFYFEILSNIGSVLSLLSLFKKNKSRLMRPPCSLSIPPHQLSNS